MDHIAIITAIEDAALSFRLKPTTIGQYAVSNRRLHANLVAGGDCRKKTAKRLLAWIADAKATRGAA